MTDADLVRAAARRIETVCPAHLLAHHAGLPLERAYAALVALESAGIAKVLAEHTDGKRRRPSRRVWRVM